MTRELNDRKIDRILENPITIDSCVNPGVDFSLKYFIPDSRYVIYRHERDQTILLEETKNQQEVINAWNQILKDMGWIK